MCRLVLRSAESLHETQPVFIAGFPLGETGGSNVKINPYILSSKQRQKGVLDMLQIQGQMKPGNSGGPVLDGDGNVIGVCVSVLLMTDMNYAIPSEKVSRFLEGRLADLTLEPPSRADSGLRICTRSVAPASSSSSGGSAPSGRWMSGSSASSRRGRRAFSTRRRTRFHRSKCSQMIDVGKFIVCDVSM